MKKSSNLLSALKMAFVAVFLIAFSNAHSQAVVSVDKMNIIYRGIENPVSVAVPNVASNLVQVVASNATVRKIDDVHYMLLPTTNAQSLSFNVFSVTGKDTTWYGSFMFRVLPVPAPVLRVAGIAINGEEASLTFAMLKAQPYLSAALDNFLFDIKFSVTSFIISFTNGEEVVSEDINGNQISKSFLDKIGKMEKPVKVTISNVVVQGPDAKRAAVGASFLVK